MKVLVDGRANWQVFNVGGGKAYTVLELGKMIAKKLEVKFQPEISGQFRLGDIRHAVSDITKLKMLGWHPQVSEETAVSQYIDWIKTQKISKNYLEEAEENLRKMGILRKAKKK